MRDCVRDSFLSFTQRFEGHTTWFYLDVGGKDAAGHDLPGLVTIGYGDLCDPVVPAVLDFRDRAGNRATPAQVSEEWHRIKSLQHMKMMGGGVFSTFAQLRATEASIEALFHAVMERDWAAMVGWFPEAEDWPADAQLGVMSLAWADGENFPSPKNPHGYPKFSAAARARDWLTCAAECGISEVGNPGVHDRNIATRSLFTCAAYTLQPELLSTA